MCPADETYLELKKIPWFRDLKDEHLRKIADISHLRRFKSGEVFFREGDKEDFLYVVVEGRVALDMFVPPRGKTRFYSVEPWDTFGWSSVTPVIHQRTAGAVAVMDGVAVATNSEELRKVCEEDHDLGYFVMRRLANVVASRLMVTRLQLLDMFAEPTEKKNA
jgi:CRP/FNR family transcriptional regulator, cyclic AMP receptor protein